MNKGPLLRLAYYGDDFTGSTDVMESLALAGVPTRLFLRAPTPGQLQKHPDLQAVGVAGSSRAMTPAQMEAHLPPVFEALRGLGPPLVHYKICSTFDSSPAIGSIGRAAEIGQRIFNSPFVPMAVGAPVLGRYVLFGNLFARSGGDSDVFRLDRHPTMRHHPVTPMDEADLSLHLAKQTTLPVRLFDVLRLALPEEKINAAFRQIAGGQQAIVLFDTLTEAHQPVIGRLVWQHACADRPLFAVASSGLEYALTAHWREMGNLPAPRPPSAAAPVDRLLVVSGSCSPVTARQIAHAVERGFSEIALRPEQLLGDEPYEQRLEPVFSQALDLLHTGRSVILHSCRGPDDPRIPQVKQQLERIRDQRPGQVLGTVLGRLLRDIALRAGLRRVACTGGDTSGYVAEQLGVESLAFVAPLAPGSPLCRIASPGRELDGIEVTFKGGQVGRDDFFSLVLKGQI